MDLLHFLKQVYILACAIHISDYQGSVIHPTLADMYLKKESGRLTLLLSQCYLSEPLKKKMKTELVPHEKEN